MMNSALYLGSAIIIGVAAAGAVYFASRKPRKKPRTAQFLEEIDEEFLLLEARDVLLTIVSGTHRLNKWSKTLGYGTVYFECSASLYYEISLLNRVRCYEFRLVPSDVEVKFTIRDAETTNDTPVLNEVLAEIRDLLQLYRFVDMVNTRDYDLFRTNTEAFNELIEKMDWAYKYHYRALAENIVKRVHTQELSGISG